MSKINLKYINKDFFKRNIKKCLVLITVPILAGTLIVSSLFASYRNFQDFCATFYNRVDYNSSYLFEKKEPWGADAYDVYNKPGETRTVTFTYQPANEYRVGIQLGKSECDYYRILIRSETEFNVESQCVVSGKVVECSEWLPIPNDNHIIIKRSDFSEQQYGNSFRIQFGKYDKTSGEVVYSEDEFRDIFRSNCSKEEVAQFEEIIENMISDVKKMIKEDDSEYDKAKKAYDYVMARMQYNHNPLGDRSRFVDMFGRVFADCTYYSNVFSRICTSIGIDSFRVLDDTHGHVWNVVKIDGEYYHVDITYSDTGSFSATDKYRYFLVSDEFMLSENRYFTKEIDVPCNKMYDLTGIISEKNVGVRGLK